MRANPCANGGQVGRLHSPVNRFETHIMVRNSAKAKGGRRVESSSAVRLMFSTALAILMVLSAALAPKVHAAAGDVDYFNT